VVQVRCTFGDRPDDPAVDYSDCVRLPDLRRSSVDIGLMVSPEDCGGRVIALLKERGKRSPGIWSEDYLGINGRCFDE